MDLAFIAFIVFALTAIASALAVITVKNPVHAVLSLVLTFFSVACLWIIIGAEFLGVTLILVYVGAVMVLFLFVVMMLDIDVAPLREGFVRYLPVGLVVAAVMLAEMLVLIGVKTQLAVPLAPNAAEAADIPNTEWLAHALFTRFLLPFETAAVILTVAVIAAVTLTLRRREGAKHQNPGEQARARAGDRVRLVKMDAVRPAPAQPSDASGAADEVKP
ncbi:NADH-quinone oxidoreductase subunit J [Lysobacter sp. F60174L2]|uniref:NADH-quinone oxidoreductase subunit J n=1 Tax=Lysobacter sp. F60174L2 TaxID=3459295 RepID=UPI00403D8EF0